MNINVPFTQPILYCLLGMVIIYVLFDVKSSPLLYSSAKKLHETQIKTLVRQISRWSIAAKQDKNPFIAVLHANYAAGYFWALLDIATKDQIVEVTKIDFEKFKNKVMSIQDAASKYAIKTCPNFSSDNSYLSVLMGLKPPV